MSIKKNALFLCSLLLISLSSCNDEPENEKIPEMEWVAVSNTSPESIKVSYISPDPGCGIPKIFYIYALGKGGDVTVRCTNYENLYFTTTASNEYADENLAFTLSKVDDNTVRFHFNEFISEKEALNGDLYINSEYEGKNVRTCFSIFRSPRNQANPE